MNTADSRHPNPFPGLRPFRSNEHHLFFGRDDQTTALLQLLRTNRFLAVVGTSGSGKSSLVRAGLIAELHGGAMTQAGSTWEVMMLRPGGSPVENLARACAAADLYDPRDPGTLPRLLATLTRSRFGLVETMKQSELFKPGANLLVVVDQFEELFRFRQQGADSEETAAAFVNLLLTASEQTECPIYVAITMRSDYLGECSEIPGLAEAVNKGEYLIPRLLRDQKREAIEKPIGVGGAKISPLLVQRLLNDVGDDPDQLPVLQHALMRMWEVWSSGNDHDRPIDLNDFEATGGLASALSNHADEIYDALPEDRHRAACGKIFKTLTEKGNDNRGIRRPTRLVYLQSIAATDRDTVITVLEAFRGSGVTFLMPGAEIDLNDRTVIDLSHESLMRCWNRLRGWVEDEAQSARIFRRLVDTARLWKDGKAGLFRDPDLQIAICWRDQQAPNAEWAEQYGGDFEMAIRFLEASSSEAKAEQEAREAGRQRELTQARELSEAQRQRLEQQQRSASKLRMMIAGLAVVALLAVAACVAALFANIQAQRNEETAKHNAVQAEHAQREAEQARTASEKAREAGEAETYRAMLSEVKALRAGRESGWRQKALDDLRRLSVMPTPRRDLTELRTEAAATLGTPDICLVARLALPSNSLGSFLFSPDGKALVTADHQTGLDFWDVAGLRHLSTASDIKLAEGSFKYDKMVFLPDGQGLAVATRDRGVVFLDKAGKVTNRKPLTLGLNQPIKLAISADGRRLAVSWSGNNGTTVYDTASRTIQANIKGSIANFAISPDGKWLARHENGEIVLIPTSSGEQRIVLGKHSVPTGLVFSQQGNMLAASFLDHTAVLWDIARREQFATLRGHRERVLDLDISPDGQWIATGGLDYTTRIWETRTGQNIATLSGYASPANAVKWSPAGNYLAVNMNNAQEIYLYKITGRNEVQQWLIGHGVELKSVSPHPRREQMVTAGYSELISWNLAAPRPPAVSIGPSPGAVTGLTYNADGSLVAICSGKEILIRDPNTGKIQSRFTVPDRVDALAFDPAGKQLAFGDWAGKVVVRELATGRTVRQFSTGSIVWALSYLDGSAKLVTHGKESVILYNVETGKEEKKVKLTGGEIKAMIQDRSRARLLVGFHSGAIGSVSLPDFVPGPRLEKAHNGEMRCMALSPDGRLLATGATDRCVALRNATTFEVLLQYPPWDGGLAEIAFDYTGRRMAVVGTANEVDLWDMTRLQEGLKEIGLAWDQGTRDATAQEKLPVNGRSSSEVPVIRRTGK